MNKPVNPNLVAIVLIALAVIIVAFLPVTIRIIPNSSVAQEATATTTMDMTMLVDTITQEPRVLEYTLRTITGQTPPMAYIGVGGDIDGQINPTLVANDGDPHRITMINGDSILHDQKIDKFNAFTGELTTQEQAVASFVEYYNHRRYHEALVNVMPADVYFGRAEQLQTQRQIIKLKTLAQRRAQHLLLASSA